MKSERNYLNMLETIKQHARETNSSIQVIDKQRITIMALVDFALRMRSHQNHFLALFGFLFNVSTYATAETTAANPRRFHHRLTAVWPSRGGSLGITSLRNSLRFSG